MPIQRIALNCCFAAAMALALAAQPQAAQARVLYSFSGSDGAWPSGNIIRDANGNFYGTTVTGGATGYGVVFKLAPDGTETVLHSFNGGAGASPTGLRQDRTTGDLYGVKGGNCNCNVIYKLTLDGTETVLHNFAEDSFYFPVGLRRDSAGNLFGVAKFGGCGAVYELAADGTFSILHEFDRAHGCYPNSRLITDKQHNLYGTAARGGSHCSAQHGCGVVFKLTQDGTYSVLHDFRGRDGNVPLGLVRDDEGNIYGTTAHGGDGGGKFSHGLVFKLAPNGKFSVMHIFTGYGTADGGGPGGDLVSTGTGMIYGTTEYGGGSGCVHNGCGTIFSVAPDGTFTTIYWFSRRSVGACPSALLTEEGDHNIYGTTAGGGANDVGTVFKVRQ
jgi:uncharacterized repeat protein (TIGR03803 family)